MRCVHIMDQLDGHYPVACGTSWMISRVLKVYSQLLTALVLYNHQATTEDAVAPSVSEETSSARNCCAECGVAGAGVRLKVCKGCMHAKYCNAKCQMKHWPTHKKELLRDEALFKDPPPKGDCPICFLPMPRYLISCATLPDATITSVPIYDFAKTNEELKDEPAESCYSCCGKSICGGCIHSCCMSGNMKCPFCNADRSSKTAEEEVEEIMKRVEANDPASIFTLGDHYYQGINGFPRDETKAVEQYARAAELGFSQAHFSLGAIYHERGDLKKAKFHYEAAAMEGDELARYNIGCMEAHSGNMKRAVKHLKIGASAGDSRAMQSLISLFEQGTVSRESIESTLTAYNSSCSEMRSEARDAIIRAMIETIATADLADEIKQSNDSVSRLESKLNCSLAFGLAAIIIAVLFLIQANWTSLADLVSKAGHGTETLMFKAALFHEFVLSMVASARKIRIVIQEEVPN